VGRISKPHGLSGEVIVELYADPRDRLEPGSAFSTRRGELSVVSSRPHQGRFIVRFEGCDDRNGADALRGIELLGAPVDDPGTLWVHELVGSEVVTTAGQSVGTVTAVEANPASDLLVLDGGALIPLRFVVAHDPGRQVIVDVPEGLIDPE
jgi:16S rRNA processing protein RimM